MKMVRRFVKNEITGNTHVYIDVAKPEDVLQTKIKVNPEALDNGFISYDRAKVLLENAITLALDLAFVGATDKVKIDFLKEELGITDDEIKALDISL